MYCLSRTHLQCELQPSQLDPGPPQRLTWSVWSSGAWTSSRAGCLRDKGHRSAPQSTPPGSDPRVCFCVTPFISKMVTRETCRPVLTHKWKWMSAPQTFISSCCWGRSPPVMDALLINTHVCVTPVKSAVVVVHWNRWYNTFFFF